MALEIFVASPCAEPWASMQGDDRARFCLRCREHVFALAALSEPEIHALLREKQGRVCARFFRRRDGTVLTRDCPDGVARVRRRALRGLVGAVALLASVIGLRARTWEGEPQPAEDRAMERLNRKVGARFRAGVEVLRESRFLGPAVDELWPRRIMGRVSTITVIRAP